MKFFTVLFLCFFFAVVFYAVISFLRFAYVRFKAYLIHRKLSKLAEVEKKDD